MGQAIPDRMFASPAGTSGNFSLGGYDPGEDRSYIMYFFSGGGYGGWWETDGLTNGCSTVGISKTQPVEILEQHYPLVFEEYALREGSSSRPAPRRLRHQLPHPPAARHRDGVLPDGPRTRGAARPDGRGARRHQRADRQPGRRHQRARAYFQGRGYELHPGDWVQVHTPGGGGYGDAHERDPAQVRRDVERGYISASEALHWYARQPPQSRSGAVRTGTRGDEDHGQQTHSGASRSRAPQGTGGHRGHGGAHHLVAPAVGAVGRDRGRRDGAGHRALQRVRPAGSTSRCRWRRTRSTPRAASPARS